MVKEICFDMDGTIANLYAVEDWLPMLRAEDTTPYEIAPPMFSMNSLARVLNNAKRHGWTLKVISWSSKTGTPSYNERVREAKTAWLHKHLASVVFDEINVIPYGTPKSRFGNGVLFDDEERNREEWRGIAYDVNDIIATIQRLVKEEI